MATPTRHAWRVGSLWLEQALAAESEPPSGALAHDLDADVCIVGGGYLGLWTALRLRELDPTRRVVLLEADVCGSGASGRNGGFVLSWWPKVETLIERVGRDAAFALAEASAAAIVEIGSFCESEGIDAHYVRSGWIWSATSDAQLGSWNGAVAAAASGGAHPFEVLPREEIVERLGSPIHLGGVFEANAATVHPALLARGLRRVALRRGVEIFERTPVHGVDRDRGLVRSGRQTVRAATIVLATNAWAAQVRSLRTGILPLSSDIVATEPVPDLLEQIGWTGGESVSNSRLMVDYYRTTSDGRIVLGRGGGAVGRAGRFGADFDYDARRGNIVADRLVRLAPALRAVRVTHAWGGAVDRTTDGLPFFGVLPGRARVLYGVGFSGNGIGPTLMGAKILASSALELDDEWSRSPLNRGVPSRFPPEPARHLGGRLVRAAVQRKEEREDRGLSVDGLTRRIAALAPSGFFKVSKGNGEVALPGVPAEPQPAAKTIGDAR